MKDSLKEKAKVVMLPNNEADRSGNTLSIYKWSGQLGINTLYGTNPKTVIAQHLYIVSNREIKEMDHFITFGDINGKQSTNFSNIYKCSAPPKLTSNDEVIILPLKERMYTEEEFKDGCFEAFYKGYRDCEAERYCPADINREFNKWMKTIYSI